MCYTDVRHFLPGLNLAYTDRASMAASTEVRVPYVDRGGRRRLRHLRRRKIEGWETKAVLKKAAEPYLKEVIYRPKGCSAHRCAPGSAVTCRPMVEDLLMAAAWPDPASSTPAICAGWSMRTGPASPIAPKEIWQLMTLETWLQQQSAPL